MKAGQRLTAPDGFQVCLYPLPSLDVIQSSPSAWSHCCGYAIDVNTVPPSSYATMYAPCNCTKYYQDSVGNSCAFISDQKVHTPKGLSYVCFQFTHGKLLGNGKTYKQGDPIYTTGLDNAGNVDHCHIDQAFCNSASDKVYMKNMGVVCQMGNYCWVLSKSCPANQVFFVNDTTIGRVGQINGVAMKWLTWTKGGNNILPDGGGSTSNPSLKWVIPVIEGNEYTRSRYLTEAEMKNNFRCFYGEMHARGWSLNAICGMLGNIQSESQCNPNTWQGLYIYSQPTNTEGFGLVQWTPYTKIKDWLTQRGVWGKFSQYGTAQCERIEWEVQNNAQWMSTSAYPMSFQEFKKSTASPSYLALVFLANYERPLNPYQPIRGTQAQTIYNYLKGFKPEVPDGAIINGEFNPDDSQGNAGQNKKKWKFIYYLKGKNK